MPVKSVVADLSDSESGAEGVMPEAAPEKPYKWETWCVVVLLLLFVTTVQSHVRLSAVSLVGCDFIFLGLLRRVRVQKAHLKRATGKTEAGRFIHQFDVE